MISNNVTTAIKKVRTKATLQQTFGWMIAIFNGLMVMASFGATGLQSREDIIMVTIFTVFTALGVLLIIKGCKRKKLIKQYYNYAARLSADPDKSIDFLSSSIGAPVAAVTKNITDMLALGFFPGAFLDSARNRIVMQNANPAPAQTAVYATGAVPSQPQQAVTYVTVKCKGCGATNKLIAGTVGECEFCGSQLSEN